MKHFWSTSRFPFFLSALAIMLALSLVASDTNIPYLLGTASRVVAVAVASVQHVMAGLHAALA
jgi:hypothetical protein